MTKRKALKKIVAFFAVVSIIATMFSFNVFAASQKVVPASTETFDSMTTTLVTKNEGALWTSGGYGTVSYEADSEGGYKYKLTCETTDPNTGYLKASYLPTPYANATFSVEYTPVNVLDGVKVGASNYEVCGVIGFRVRSTQTGNYALRLYTDKIELKRQNNWTLETLGTYETPLLNGTSYNIKVSYNTVDSKNYIKVWLNDVEIITYEGDLSNVETYTATGETEPKYLTASYIGLGMMGSIDIVDDELTENIDEGTEINEQTVVMFDDFTIYGDVLDYTFNANTDFSTTKQGPYWYYMSEQRSSDWTTDIGTMAYLSLNNGTNGGASLDWNATIKYSWYDVDGGIQVGPTMMKQSGKTNHLLAVKMFKAPFNGVITIGADGNLNVTSTTSQIQIRKNNDVVWPTESDAENWTLATNNTFANVTSAGHTFTPITLNVSKGDEIYFVVKGNSWIGDVGDKTYWVPTVKYTEILDMGMNASLTDGEITYANLALLKAAGENAAKDVVIKANVSCDGGENNPYQILVATYNDSGILLNAKVENSATISDNDVALVSVPLGTTTDISSVASVKVFLIDSTNTIMPLSGAVTIK